MIFNAPNATAPAPARLPDAVRRCPWYKGDPIVYGGRFKKLPMKYKEKE
jgi:hypothetical protein